MKDEYDRTVRRALVALALLSGCSNAGLHLTIEIDPASLPSVDEVRVRIFPGGGPLDRDFGAVDMGTISEAGAQITLAPDDIPTLSLKRGSFSLSSKIELVLVPSDGGEHSVLLSGALFHQGAWLGDGATSPQTGLSSHRRDDATLSLACLAASCTGPVVVDLEQPPTTPAVVQVSNGIGPFYLLAVGNFAEPTSVPYSSLVLAPGNAVTIYKPVRIADGTVPRSPDSLSQSVLIDNGPSSHFGAATIGDLNGDGIADLVIAAPTDGGGAGMVYVVDGGALPSSGVAYLGNSTVSLRISGDVGEQLGSTLAILPSPMGNLLAVGARWHGTNAGAVYVFPWQRSQITSQNAMVKIIDVTPSAMPFSALAVGDFDGMGPALAIGSPGDSAVYLLRSQRIVNSGQAIDLGPTPPLLADGMVIGPGDFGTSLASGFLRGTSTRMLAVGAPGADAVYVFEGSTIDKWKTPTWKITGFQGSHFGTAIAIGRPDTSDAGSLWIGAPGSSPFGRTGAGASYLFRGSSLGDPGLTPTLAVPSATLVAWGPFDGDGLGAQVALGNFDISDDLDMMFVSNSTNNSTGSFGNQGAIYGIKGVPVP
jgi:hypothetical protein